MTEFFDIRDADQGVIDLISQVEAGKDFFITRGREPVALIIKFEGNSPEELSPLKYGATNGLIPEWTDEDWEHADEPIRASWDAEHKCPGEE